MKIKTTRKSIVDNYPANRIISVGYCGLANLLSVAEPIAYTCGVYGWNFDVYNVDGLIICTGYRGMPGRRANGEREFEEKARAIRNNYSMPYDERVSSLKELLSEFAAQA